MLLSRSRAWLVRRGALCKCAHVRPGDAWPKGHVASSGARGRCKIQISNLRTRAGRGVTLTPEDGAGTQGCAQGTARMAIRTGGLIEARRWRRRSVRRRDTRCASYAAGSWLDGGAQPVCDTDANIRSSTCAQKKYHRRISCVSAHRRHGPGRVRLVRGLETGD